MTKMTEIIFRTLWTYLIPCELYIYICRHDNFIELNKLSLKYQNAYNILNAFAAEDNNNFPKLKDFFQKNALIFNMSI